MTDRDRERYRDRERERKRERETARERERESEREREPRLDSLRVSQLNAFVQLVKGIVV